MKSSAFILFLLLITNIIFCQDKISKKEARKIKRAEHFEEAKQLINLGSYEFTAQAAYPQGGRRIDLTANPNYLRIKNDTTSADLPFFGRAYSAEYGLSGGGTKFDGKPREFSVEVNEKKQHILISFKIRGADDSYTCLLTVSSLSNASLNVTSNNKANISYSGQIAALVEE